MYLLHWLTLTVLILSLGVMYNVYFTGSLESVWGCPVLSTLGGCMSTRLSGSLRWQLFTVPHVQSYYWRISKIYSSSNKVWHKSRPVYFGSLWSRGWHRLFDTTRYNRTFCVWDLPLNIPSTPVTIHQHAHSKHQNNKIFRIIISIKTDDLIIIFDIVINLVKYYYEP